MSDEERQRQMDFIIQQQAQLTAIVGQLAETVSRTAGSVNALLAIAELHDREIAELRGAAKDTDERLNALIDTVERYVAGRGGA